MNRNYSDISYAESPFGTLSEFMSKTFGWMFAGLLVTFLVGIGAVTTGLIYPLITSGLFILTSIAELVLVFVLSARVQTLQPSTATGIFFAYAVLNGLNLSSIFLAYDFGSLILAFLVGAVYFGVMAVYGNVTNRDLTGWGPKLMGGLVALIVCGLVGGHACGRYPKRSTMCAGGLSVRRITMHTRIGRICPCALTRRGWSFPRRREENAWRNSCAKPDWTWKWRMSGAWC